MRSEALCDELSSTLWVLALSEIFARPTYEAAMSRTTTARGAGRVLQERLGPRPAG